MKPSHPEPGDRRAAKGTMDPSMPHESVGPSCLWSWRNFLAMKMAVFLLHCSSQHNSSSGAVGWPSCHRYPDKGSAVFPAQGWGVTGKGFDQGNPKDGPSALSASLFLEVPRDSTKSILRSSETLKSIRGSILGNRS